MLTTTGGSHTFINHWDEAIEDLIEIFKIQPNTPMLVAWAPGARVGMRWWEQVEIDLVRGGGKQQWRRWKGMGEKSDKWK